MIQSYDMMIISCIVYKIHWESYLV